MDKELLKEIEQLAIEHIKDFDNSYSKAYSYFYGWYSEHYTEV